MRKILYVIRSCRANPSTAPPSPLSSSCRSTSMPSSPRTTRPPSHSPRKRSTSGGSKTAVSHSTLIPGTSSEAPQRRITPEQVVLTFIALNAPPLAHRCRRGGVHPITTAAGAPSSSNAPSPQARHVLRRQNDNCRLRDAAHTSLNTTHASAIVGTRPTHRVAMFLPLTQEIDVIHELPEWAASIATDRASTQAWYSSRRPARCS